MGKHLPKGHLSLAMQDALKRTPLPQLPQKNVWAQSPYLHQQIGTLLGASVDANPISKHMGMYSNPKIQLELKGRHICIEARRLQDSAFGFPLQQVAAPPEAAQGMREFFLSMCHPGIFFYCYIEAR